MQERNGIRYHSDTESAVLSACRSIRGWTQNGYAPGRACAGFSSCQEFQATWSIHYSPHLILPTVMRSRENQVNHAVAGCIGSVPFVLRGFERRNRWDRFDVPYFMEASNRAFFTFPLKNR